MWRTRRKDDAPVSHEVQLHAGDMARLIGHPEDRRTAAQSYIESVGGKLHGFWYAFGPHDAYTLWEAPDNVSMAAVALAITGGGALNSLDTTALLTVDETLDALRKAGRSSIDRPARSGLGGSMTGPGATRPRLQRSHGDQSGVSDRRSCWRSNRVPVAIYYPGFTIGGSSAS